MSNACKLAAIGSVGVFFLASLTAETTASATGPAAPPAFARCAACHSVVRGAPNKMGPNLAGIVGSKAATRPGGRYSPALKKSGIVWNKANLAAYLKNTQTTVPGTTMPNPNISRKADSDAIIAYLTASK